MGRTKKSNHQSQKEDDQRESIQTRNTRSVKTTKTTESKPQGKNVNNGADFDSVAEEVPRVKMSQRQKRKLEQEQTADGNSSKKNRRSASRSSEQSMKQEAGSEQQPSAAVCKTESQPGKPAPRPSNARKKSPKKKNRGETGDSASAAADAVTGVGSVKEEGETDGTGDSGRHSQKLVGAHCSIAGGLHKAVEEAVAIGGQAFGLFLRSQRSWTSKPLDPEAAEKFKAACKAHGFAPNSILPHGSYLMNCGSPNPDTLRKSREALLEELQRCEALELTLYNFHPGSTCGEIDVEECLDKIADAINWAHAQTKFVTTVVENMSCQGNTVGGHFEELKGIIDRVKDKSRIGICLDTCHAFAAGFDLSCKEGFEKFVTDFDTIVGFQYLKALHLNDSKGGVGCHLDRHENIGKGQIGLEGFRRVMADPRFNGIPMILETPLGDYAAEIKTLNRLI